MKLIGIFTFLDYIAGWELLRKISKSGYNEIVTVECTNAPFRLSKRAGLHAFEVYSDLFPTVFFSTKAPLKPGSRPKLCTGLRTLEFPSRDHTPSQPSEPAGSISKTDF
jgi:hypothetical protein